MPCRSAQVIIATTNSCANRIRGIQSPRPSNAIPQATFASKIEIQGEAARVTREVDAGLETLEVDLPAVITTDLRLNEPRYIKLPDIMKAKKKPLDVVELASLGIDATPLVKVVKYEPPPQRQKGVMVKDAAELVAALKQRGLV
jgi:electron transfer flavoprotein beta subunit